MLEDSNVNVFRVPFNQANVAFGKVRVRPFARGTGKIATSFDNYNKEVLIVESLDKNICDLLTSNKDKYVLYNDLKKTYLHGLIGVFVLFLMVLYKIFSRSADAITYIAGIVIVVVMVAILYLFLKTCGRCNILEKELE